MPAYHSKFLETEKNAVSGFALPIISQGGSLQTENGDIIDEAIMLFRPNAYFRNFEIRGPADRTLAYLLLFIGDCLGKLKAGQAASDAKQQLSLWASSGFALPGDAQLSSLKTLFPEPKSRQEADQLRDWLIKARIETLNRLLSVIYQQDPKAPSEWWMAYQKRRFMGKTLGA